MIITVQCPACETTFPVDPRKVPDGGVKVRCSACSGIFFVDKPEIPPQVPIPDAPVAAGPAVAAPPTASSAPSPPPAPAPVSAAAAGIESAEADDAPTDDAHAPPPAGDEPVARAEASEPAAHDDVPEPVAPAVSPTGGDEERGNVDPWSGAGWDDPSDMGAPDDEGPADPWSGGVGLDEPIVAAAASDDPASSDGAPTGDETSTTGEMTPDERDGAPADDWVVERSVEARLDTAGAEVERLDTIEEQTRAAAAELVDATTGSTDADYDPADWDAAAVPPAAESRVEAPAVEPSEPAETIAEAAEEAAPTEPRPSGFQFGKRDPHDKARRLARVLVSDIITYNPERHQQALAQGSLHADFEEEIRKSWAEYVEQVGRELAESTPYWFDALNEILARGESVF